MSSLVKEFQHLRISLQDLKSATSNFAETNCIGRGGFGKVYRGKILLSGVLTVVAVKRLDRSFGQGTTEFWKEIMLLCQYKHENLVSLLGFCDEGGENILVYEYLSRKSLDLHLNSVYLSWHHRLVICLEAAMGLQYLHEPVGRSQQQRVIHRDIKSANILLAHNWRPKIADFGLSKLGPANQQFTFVFSNAVGTMGYCDPLYADYGFLTKESDVYSFGVVLLEVLCGRPCVLQKYNDIRRSLVALSRKCYEEWNMHTIIQTGLKDKLNSKCLRRFSDIAYQCLQLDRAKRPTMGKVVEELRCALYYQIIHQTTIQAFPFKVIEEATNNFKMYIAQSYLGSELYKGELSIFGIPTSVFIQKFPEHPRKTLSFNLNLVDKLSKAHHPSFISALGYCYEKREKIIVYECPKRGSLDQYIRRSNTAYTTLTWLQRLEICAGAGHVLSYLLSNGLCPSGLKSASIFLDDNWVAKIGNFEIYTQCSSTVINRAYSSPEYIINGIETEKNDVYCFGMVLFEVLCGRLCTEKVDGNMLSAKRIKELYEKKKLNVIVDPALVREEKINSYSVDKFSSIAYRCLLDNPRERPYMNDVAIELQEILSIEKSRLGKQPNMEFNDPSTTASSSGMMGPSMNEDQNNIKTKNKEQSKLRCFIGYASRNAFKWAENGNSKQTEKR